jgi:dCMP deaminase
MAKDMRPNSIRPSWDDYFLELAEAASKRATCGRGRSGCVIVRDRQVLVTGYVGSPSGLPHCDDVGHLIKTITDENGEASEHCVRTVHSEQMSITTFFEPPLTTDIDPPG